MWEKEKFFFILNNDMENIAWKIAMENLADKMVVGL